MPEGLPELAERIRALGVHRTPPLILLTRWQALVGDDEPMYFDAAHESGQDVPGSRYSFVAATDGALCYLSADHDDDMWEYDRQVSRMSGEITPRSMVAWCRPISAVTEIALAGSPWDWLADEAVTRAVRPVYRLRVAGDDVELPLPSKHRQGIGPDPASVLARVRECWRA